MRTGYCGCVDECCYRFDAELVEKVVAKLTRGKAAGLDGFTTSCGIGKVI